MTQSPPLQGVRVLEFAGLAPGPFTGLLCADYGATVLRLDRAHPSAHSSSPTDPPPPTSDQLTRRKTSIALNPKTPSGRALLLSLISEVDILIDPFRPGVLEKLGLDPEKELLRRNPRLIVARLTGFRRDGKYSAMAGHDINYIAVSGVLAMLGRAGEKPYAPANLLGDFAGGGLTCFLGIVMALLRRERGGGGQVVEANMVDGAAYLGTFPRLATKGVMWGAERGGNTLDGGAPYYDIYETRDGGYMAVGALEERFYVELLKGLGLTAEEATGGGNRLDKRSWGRLRENLTKKFKEKTRAEWETTFDGTDACCTPVLTQKELEVSRYDQRPVVTLKSSPGLAVQEADPDGRPAAEGQGIGVEGDGWSEKGMSPGAGGEETLAKWMGWRKGRHYEVVDGALEAVDKGARAKM